MRASTRGYLIVRTVWLFGEFGKWFPKTMRDLSGSHDTLNVVTDGVRRPTWTADLADLIVRLVLAAAPSGIHHGTFLGETTWDRFPKEVPISIGKDRAIIVKPTTADVIRRAALRPHYSVLGRKNLTAIDVLLLAVGTSDGAMGRQPCFVIESVRRRKARRMARMSISSVVERVIWMSLVR